MTPERRFACKVTLAKGTAEGQTGRFSSRGTFVEGVGPARIPDGLTDLTRHVLSVRTTKSIGSPVGTFEVSFTFEGLDRERRAALYKLLTPDNLLLLDFDAGIPGSRLTRVMEGWVSGVTERTMLGADGRPQRACVISGHDAGKFLVRHELPGHLMTAFVQGDEEQTRRLAEGLVVQGSVGEVLRRIFQDLFLRLVPAPEAVQRFVAMLTHPALEPSHVHFPDDALVSVIRAQSIWTRHGKFWNILRDFLDAPWNEAWTDYLPESALYVEGGRAPYGDYVRTVASSNQDARAVRGGFNIIVRPQPFTPALWRALPVTVVPDVDILMQTTRLSDDERVNLVIVAPSGNIRAQTDQYLQGLMFQTVHFDRADARRHGTQVLQASSRYSDIEGAAHSDPAQVRDASSGRGDMFDALATRARRLWDVYSPNARFWKGMMILAGNPDVKIGTRLENQTAPSSFFDPDEYERRQYYVERVVHDYVDGGNYRTHVAVTRGQPVGELLAAVEPETIAA